MAELSQPIIPDAGLLTDVSGLDTGTGIEGLARSSIAAADDGRDKHYNVLPRLLL
jgi:hypothetical protein